MFELSARPLYRATEYDKAALHDHKSAVSAHEESPARRRGVSRIQVYPKWLGWVAVALGIGSFTVGTVQAYVGLSVLGTNFLFAGFASLLTVWVLVMGILMWRKARSAT